LEATRRIVARRSDATQRLCIIAMSANATAGAVVIAATAVVHSLTVVTRSTGDFLNFGVRLFNPFPSTTPEAPRCRS